MTAEPRKGLRLQTPDACLQAADVIPKIPGVVTLYRCEGSQGSGSPCDVDLVRLTNPVSGEEVLWVSDNAVVSGLGEETYCNFVQVTNDDAHAEAAALQRRNMATHGRVALMVAPRHQGKTKVCAALSKAQRCVTWLIGAFSREDEFTKARVAMISAGEATGAGRLIKQAENAKPVLNHITVGGRFTSDMANELLKLRSNVDTRLSSIVSGGLNKHVGFDFPYNTVEGKAFLQVIENWLDRSHSLSSSLWTARRHDSVPNQETFKQLAPILDEGIELLKEAKKLADEAAAGGLTLLSSAR